MKKRSLVTLAAALMVAGIGSTLIGLVGNYGVSADATAAVLNEGAAFTSFVTFGVAMLVASIVLFFVLSQL